MGRAWHCLARVQSSGLRSSLERCTQACFLISPWFALRIQSLCFVLQQEELMEGKSLLYQEGSTCLYPHVWEALGHGLTQWLSTW